jgi:hypothetical protein
MAIMAKINIIQQLKTNLVAIISLLTALGGLSYNTWRDHRNEVNENMRNAAFEVLKNLGELQTVVNYAHYQSDRERGSPIEGWKYVLLVRDLSHLLPQSNMQQSAALFTVWQQEWEQLASSPQSEQRISVHIANTRADVLNTLQALQ